MSQEVFEIIQNMDIKDIQTQLALQCAPLIAGLKVSNLLNISKSKLKQIREILKGTILSYRVLGTKGKKVTILLYNQKELDAYLADGMVQDMFASLGYPAVVLDEILPIFSARYQHYMENNQNFPHEMGLLLGYPVEDVEGFIRNGGKNYLHIGYWKVYANLSEKLQLFSRFERAKETIIQMISNGVLMADVISIYQEEKLQRAAI